MRKVSICIASYLCMSVEHGAPENLDAPAGFESVVPRIFALRQRCI
jgi:hypothetical protein